MKKIHTLRSLSFAVAFCAALGFGAQAALASPPACPRTSVGKCTSLEQCQSTCASIGSDPAQARCETDGGVGCCYCPFIL